MKSKAFTIVFLIVISTHSTTGKAELITNGDFETGSFAGWTVSGVVAVGSRTSYANIGGSGEFPAGGEFFATFGAGNLPASGVLSQTVATSSGGAYKLTFDYGSFSLVVGSGSQSIEVVIEDEVSNNVLASQTIVDTTPTTDYGILFDSFEILFSATSNSSTVAFRDVSTMTVNIDGFLDNVSLTLIPEPATSSLWGALFISGALIRFRGRGQVANGG